MTVHLACLQAEAQERDQEQKLEDSAGTLEVAESHLLVLKLIREMTPMHWETRVRKVLLVDLLVDGIEKGFRYSVGYSGSIGLVRLVAAAVQAEVVAEPAGFGSAQWMYTVDSRHLGIARHWDCW